jgi:hypothetical protein
MSRVIIKNETDLPDSTVLPYVIAVMIKGKKQGAGRRYNRVSHFDEVVVYVERNKQSDRFVVRRV